MDQSTTARSAAPSAWAGRVEDDALLRGQGRFGDDVKPEGALAAYFVRSPHAFAKIERIDARRRKRRRAWWRCSPPPISKRRIIIRSRIRIRFPAAAARWRSRRIARRSLRSG